MFDGTSFIDSDQTSKYIIQDNLQEDSENNSKSKKVKSASNKKTEKSNRCGEKTV
jgi:hypothetical protein